jgi:hypothetical protein
MENLVSFFPLIIAILICALVVSFFAFVTGVVRLFAIKRQVAKTRGQQSVRTPAALAIVGGIIFLFLTFFSAKLFLILNTERDLQQYIEPSTCLELSVAEGYKLQIIQFDDGTQDAELQRADGSLSFTNGITHYTREGNIVIAEIGSGATSDFWALFELSTERLELFGTKMEYLAALRYLGFAEEPTLQPVESYCQDGRCRPCPGSISRFLKRPPQTDQELELFTGVTYLRDERSTPRPLMVHVVTVDLTAPGIEVLVTPGGGTDELEFPARTTSDFLTGFDLQVAINGSFFEPFHENTPWDYYPHSGDPTDVDGLSVSNGVTYSVDDGRHPVLCVSADNHAQISGAGCPADTAQALAAGNLIVDAGVPIAPEDERYYTNLHPRTAVAVDERGERLWLIVVDGRQRGYSEGVALSELADIAVELGAYAALNLDGGGSTTLVAQGHQGPYTLNSPIHTRIPMRQRPVANHLGIYALPSDRRDK